MQDVEWSVDVVNAQQRVGITPVALAGSEFGQRFGEVAAQRARVVEQDLRPGCGAVAELAAYDDAFGEQSRIEPACLSDADRDAGHERQQRGLQRRPGDDCGIVASRKTVAQHDAPFEHRHPFRQRSVRREHDRIDRGVFCQQRARDDAGEQRVADPAAGRDQQRALRWHSVLLR